MSTSTQHDDASGKQKAETLQDWVNKSPDNVTKRIRSLYCIPEMPSVLDLSDKALLFNGTAADYFFYCLGTRSVSAKDIGIDKYGRIFLKTGELRSNEKSYQAEIQRAVQLAHAREELLQSINFVVRRVSELPGVRSSLSNVWHFASYAQRVAENGLDDMDCDALEELRGPAQEEIDLKMSEISEAMGSFDRYHHPNPSDSDILKSTDVLRGTVELFQLSASEVEELEELMQDPQRSYEEVCDLLGGEFYSFEELQGFIECLEWENASYRECRSACLQPIIEHRASKQELEPTNDQLTGHFISNSTNKPISTADSQKSDPSPINSSKSSPSRFPL
ncbi:hypothetical protein N0V85_003955 [Neurospora sp. IMI 360204]|nr:hypothetical protein N0V85_003955 [Neurospora sp. IMI 360204]